MAKKRKSKTSYETDDERLIREQFDLSIRALRECNDYTYPKIFDMTGSVLKRRKSAALSMMPEMISRFGHYYLRESDLKRDFTYLCTSFGRSVDGSDNIYYITAAAALWMLDDLDQTNKLEAAYLYFSKNTDELIEVDLPDIRDSCFDPAVFLSAIDLIQQRDGRPEGYRCYINEKSAHRKKPIEYQISDTDISDMTPRERFNAVMSMITPVMKEWAIKRFEEKFWEFLDLYFSQISIYSNQQSTLEEQIERAFQREIEWLKQVGEETDGTLFDMQNISAVIRTKPSLSDFDLLFNKEDQVSEHLRRILVNTEQLRNRCDDVEAKRITTAALMPLLQINDESETDNIDQKVVDAIQSFEIDDPYETCFAYLCLIENGSDLPWIYNAALGVVLAACRKLPWIILVEDDLDEAALENEEEDELEEDYDEFEDMPEPESDLTEEDISNIIDESWMTPKDWIDRKAQLYRRNYSPEVLYTPEEAPHPSRKVNLPQIVCSLTGVIMPRNDWREADTAEDLIASGMEPGFAQAMEYYLTAVYDSYQPGNSWRDIFDSPHFKELLKEEYEKEESEDDADTSDQLSQLREELKRERSKNRELEQRLYESQRQAEEQKREAEAAIHTVDTERAELANLRELVYQQANMQDMPEDKEEESAFSFPYLTCRKTVVFGGHDKWLKLIRPMLPNVTFVPRIQSLNADMIRTSDVVWIQPNALSHKMFYRIIDIVRTNNIPIHYFSWSSARKCAVQVVESEVEDGYFKP